LWGKRKDLPGTTSGGDAFAAGEKTVEAIQHEVAQEVNRVLQMVFSDWHKMGTIDLEAVELLVRDSMRHAGAQVVQRLLCMPKSPG
jgi:hypothetical protein